VKLVCALAVLLLGVAVFLLIGDTSPSPPPPGRDAFGDPLPPWAVARIGRFVAAPVRPPLRFSADGRTLTAAIGDGEVGTVDVATGEVLSRTRVHPPNPGTIHVEDGRVLTSLFGNDSPPASERLRIAAISPDGSRVLVTTFDQARVVTVATGEVVRTVDAYDIQSAGFTTDGSRIVIGAALPPRQGVPVRGGEVRIIDIETGRIDGVFPHAQPLGVALSGDGERIAINGWYFLYASTETREEIVRTGKFASGRRAVAFAPDGRSFARFERADLESKLFLVAHDADGGAERWRVPLAGRAGGIAYSPDGRRIAVGGSSIRQFDAADGRLVATIAEGPRWLGGVEFSPDGTLIATTRLGRLLTFDATTGEPVGVVRPPFEPLGAGVSALAWSDDAGRLATGGLDGSVHVWDAATGKRVRTVRAAGAEVSRIRLDRSGGRVAFLDADGIVSVHDLATGESTGGPGSDPNARIAFRDGRPIRIEAVPERGLLVTDGESRKLLPGSIVYHRAVRCSRDGSLVAAVGAGRTVLVWDTRAPAARDPASAFTANHVAFSPCGRFLAAHDGGPIRVHDAATGEVRFEITSYSGGSHIPLDVSPGAQLVAWAGGTSVVELWSVARGRRCTRLIGHSGRILGIRFSPDGARLASRSADGTVLIWDVSEWE